MKKLILPLMLIAAFMLAGCTTAPAPRGATGELSVVASFLPMKLLTQPVAGNVTEVRILLPPGAEPHEYEPTPSDLLALANASLLFYDSPDLEPWAERIAHSANPDMRLSPLSSAVKMRAAPGTADGTTDPHIWLSPHQAMAQADYARDQLIAADPAHAVRYRENAQAFRARLEALDDAYARALASCQSRTLITTHAALGYLAQDYNLTQVPIAGISPEEEPSPARIEEVIRTARANNATAVFIEPGLSPKLGHAVASELGVPVVSFNPLEILTPDEQAAGVDYVSLMEGNLQVLREGLGCS